MAFSQEYLNQLAGRGRVSGNYNVGYDTSQVIASAKPVSTGKQVVAPKPNFVGQVAHQAFDIGKALGGAAVNFVGHTAVDIAREAKGAFIALNPEIARARQQNISRNQAVLDGKQRQIVAAYKAGKMSKDNYTKSLQDLSKGYQGLSKDSAKLIKDSNPHQLASDLAWTAVNVLSGGTGGLVRSGAKEAGKEVIEGFAAKTVQNLEKTIARVPAARELMERNANKVVAKEAAQLQGESTEQWLARSGKQIAVGLLIKRPIFYQTNVGLANDTYKHVIDGKYDEATKSAAWIGAQMVGGGPIGWFVRNGKTGLGHIGSLARGKESFIDELSSRIGNGNRSQIADLVSKDKDAERTWKIMQTTNMTAANNKAEIAADSVMNHYLENNIDAATLTAEKVTQDMTKWAQADELAQKTIRQGVIKGVNPDEVAKYAVVRWDRSTQAGLAKAIDATDGSSQVMLDVLNKFADRPGVGWANNELLMNKLYKAVGSAQSKEEVIAEIKGISTASTIIKGVPKKVREELAGLGYTIAAPFGGNKIARVNYEDLESSTSKLVTGAIKGENTLFEAAHAPEPVLNAISGFLNKVGLSPESSNKLAHNKLSESLIGNLAELDVARSLGLSDRAATEGGDFVAGGKAVLNKLQQYVEDMQAGKFARATGLSKVSVGRSAVTDIRQLTNGEIADALHITESEAKNVSRAVRKAYTDVPLEFRGLGDKVVDYAQRVPFSPMRYYLRAQSAMRYTYNPFFRFMEVTETNILSKMQADKFLWLTPRAQLNETVKSLEQGGVFSGRFSGQTASVDANDNVIGRITANLTKGQKRNLAGLATHIAESQGKTVEQVLRDNPEQIDDALRVVVQYPREGSLASPLARTINLAFFPMRYNIKVATLVAEKLAKQPPSIQLAVLVGLHKTRGWLKSDEGIRWQSEHNEALKILAWATPWGNVQQIGNALAGNVPGHGGALSDLGLLGGLPFGFISQILDAEGIITLNKPYVNLSTGDVFPRSTPASTKAQAAVAIESLLGTMFSFPGRTLGLPGKGATIRGLVDNFINTSGKDFDKQDNMNNLTPLQQNMVRVLKGDTSDATLDSLYISPAPGEFNYYTLPPLTLPYTVRGINEPKPTPINRSLKLPKAGKGAKGKKAKPLPQPIPAR